MVGAINKTLQTIALQDSRKDFLNVKKFETVLCDYEPVINSRPFTYVSEDTTDLAPITPNMFLLDLKGVGMVQERLHDSDGFDRQEEGP